MSRVCNCKIVAIWNFRMHFKHLSHHLLGVFLNLDAYTFKLVELYQISPVLFDAPNLWLSSKELKNKLVEKFCVSADVKYMFLYIY